MNKIYLLLSAVTLLTACGHRHRDEKVYIIDEPRYERRDRVYVEEERDGRVYVKERPRIIEE